MRARFAAGFGCVTLLALAACDVRIRPVWDGPDAGLPAGVICPDSQVPVGFASCADASCAPGVVAITGGGSAAPVTVDATAADAIDQFKGYADRKSGAAVIQIQGGLISFAGFDSKQVRVASDTTIVGLDNHSGFTGGGLDLNGNSNIIVKNLVIAKAAGTDAITVQGPGSSHIWIDHCDLSSQLHPDGASYDGLVDITHAADWITVSWTRFHDHNDTGIIGHDDSNASEDTGFLHVTYDHDLFADVDAGPRVRFGTVHVLNTVFERVTLYGVASTMGAQVRVEGSYFRSVTAAGQKPEYAAVTTNLPESQAPGFVDLVKNDLDASNVAPLVNGQTTDWTPTYAYTADAAGTAQVAVVNCVGPR